MAPPSKRIRQLADKLHAQSTVSFDIPTAHGTVQVGIPLEELLKAGSKKDVAAAVEAWLNQVDKDLEHADLHQVDQVRRDKNDDAAFRAAAKSVTEDQRRPKP